MSLAFFPAAVRVSVPACVAGLLGLLSFLLLGSHGVIESSGLRADDGDHNHGESDDQPTLSWPDAIYRASPIPDRICLSLSARPASELCVTWRTAAATQASVLEVAPATDGPNFADQVRRVEGTSTLLETDLGPARYHEACISDLQAGTAYIYRVGDGEYWSEWSQTQTAENDHSPFVFVYFGDAQNDIKSQWSRVVRNAFRDAPRAAFFLHAGDLVNRGEADAEWGEWFYASSFIHRSIPVLATPGNHEMTRNAEDERRLSHHWRPTFALPQNGPAGLEETCYYVDYQGTRLISLNSNELVDIQAEWLADVLEDPTPRWKIVTFHHPIFSSAKGRDNQALRELWQPIFDQHSVDLVLQGHDHTYARSRPLKFHPGSLEEVNLAVGQERQASDSGTVYVVSVSGPKMYDLEPQPVMARWATQTQLYQVISVEGDRLRYRALTANGTQYDAFDLLRDESGTTRLIEPAADPQDPASLITN